MIAVHAWHKRLNAAVLGWVLACSAVAWWWMYQMPTGSASHHGHGGQSAAGLPDVLTPTESLLFIGTWTGMVVAMMLPVALPLAAAHHFVTRTSQRATSGSTGVFILGYLLAWAAAGLVPLTLIAVKRSVLVDAPVGPWRVAGVGVLLLGAGAFQFSSLKTRCLTVCRNPLTFVLTHDFTAGAARTLWAGVKNGVNCLGCCWALMLVQVAVGVHNLVWMGALTLLFMVERLAPRRLRIPQAVGVLLIGLGGALLLEPWVSTPAAWLVG